VELNESPTRPGSRWRLPGRNRNRGRHVRGVEPGQETDIPAFHSCPVMAGEARPGLSPAPVQDRWSLPDHGPSALECLMVSAEQFLTLYYTENRLGPPDLRLRQVRRQIEATGTYWHTQEELTFGARVAWRNSARCIGRLYWNSLRVRDRREVTQAADIADEAATHLREATNGGRIRPMITVFAPDAPGRPGPRIVSSQLVRYAGYEIADGVVIGDPANTVLTRIAEAAGWRGGRPVGRFDLLPLLVQAAGEPVTRHELPADAILEVAIEHPDFGWFADLGLRWHAVPVISDMYLDIGGVCYPAAPFNGWYMGTEIGSRNLGDTERYNQLPMIAAHMGLTTKHDRNLWKDRALTELNVAVLHSYAAAGVTVTDHHTESVRFLQHIDREEKHGRACPADWTWIVPPAASSATPVFHRYYTDFDQSPNFYRHPAPVAPTAAAVEQAAMEKLTREQATPVLAAPVLAAPVPVTPPAFSPPAFTSAKELVSRLVIREPAAGQPAARELVSQLVVRDLVPRRPGAGELASRPPAAQGPASREPSPRELASGTPAALDVVVEGSATIHDLPRRAGGVNQREGGDLRD
jgi:nitric-oxide synthase, bacterial